jgi:DNA-binding FadR family transcriptional regulator
MRDRVLEIDDVPPESDGVQGSTTEGDLPRAILSVIASRDGSVGQGAIALELRKRGIKKSVATIGRRLQELEFDGLITKVGVQGRTLTAAGGEALKRLQAEAKFRVSGAELLETLTRSDKKHLLDLLAARRALEGTAAALAAERASSKLIAQLGALLEDQAASVGRGELGIEQDVTFHQEIARASGNTVLASLVTLLRKSHRYDLAITSIRAKVGSRLVVDHGAILEAIKNGDAAAARTAMEHHLDTLAEDLERYWADSPARR